MQNNPTAKRRTRALPPPTRRGLNREAAADYIDVSPNTFDKMVKDGKMPKHVQIYGRRVWDVQAIDSAFEALFAEGDTAKPTSWD